MSLRILFADDSVTAQNMGKKILTEAGYEVVAVSNGAAAVKKIAEQKPDIIILDVYMPGYSGLEVCEKVRGSVETLKTPVLLTVGKMEPYKPEDANRVKADGVIVKPFEASDLLAIVKKFEERVARASAAAPQPTLEPAQEGIEPAQEPPIEHHAPSKVLQPTVEVPDHMATSSAFSDLLGTEPPASMNHFEPAPPAAHEATLPAKGPAAIPEYELPVSWRDKVGFEPPPPAPVAAKAAVVPPAPLREPQPHAAAPRPLQIPVYQEREAAGNAFELVPTSAPPTGEIDIPREPELQETAADATRNTVAETIEPGLVPTGQQSASVPASATEAAELAPVEESFTPAGFQDIPADIASHLPPPVPEKPAVVEPFSDAEFEARVAAAMSAYDHAHEPPAPRRSPIPEFPPASRNADDLSSVASRTAQEVREIHVQQTSPEPEFPMPVPQPRMPEPVPVEAHPSDVVHSPGTTLPGERPMPATHPAAHVFEYRPPIQVAPKPQAAEAAQAASNAKQPDHAETASEPQPVASGDHHESLAADLAAALPAVAAAGLGPGADHRTIAQAVHRVVERLKPELVEEIIRELKSKKE